MTEQVSNQSTGWSSRGGSSVPPAAPCGPIEAAAISDGVVTYVHQATDSTVPDLRDGWALWMGVFAA